MIPRSSMQQGDAAQLRRDGAHRRKLTRVLVVEDDFLQGIAIESLVAEAGDGRLEATLTSRLASALDRIREEPFDVVLLDLMLPDATGLEGLSRIARIAPHMPVVILTGLGQDELVARAFEGGAQDYLVKGVADGKELLRAIVHAVQRKASELRRLELARSDPLTGLANRAVLTERIDRARRRAEREDRPFVLLLLDLDGFKRVNDSAGHPAGDRVLREVARRLKVVTRANDTVARLGGDEFVILAEGLHAAAEAGGIAAKILQGIREPFAVGGRRFEIGGSIGVSLYPEDATAAERLIELADRAMYQAKRAGRSRFVFASAAPGHQESAPVAGSGD
ncbi:MAG: diguanylate cyclase domain-containing protein [Geminicoccaceae bacterium]